MKTTGRVNGIISNIVIVKADGAVGQNEICYVYAGDTKMMAEDVYKRQVVKFVPASGAATRMFKELFEFVNDGKSGKGIDTLLENIGKFAFWPELKALLPAGADDRTIVSAIVNEGLGYGRKPKGLVTFHAYPEGARKAVEEHLVEGAVYAAANGVAKIHFTVSPEHIEGFQELLAAKVPVYEKRFGIRYDISFSVQKPSTDTIAVNPDNTPFRQDEMCIRDRIERFVYQRGMAAGERVERSGEDCSPFHIGQR